MKKVYESPALDIVKMESANNTMLTISSNTASSGKKRGVYGSAVDFNQLN
jgi:hypothetical protein